MIQSETVVGEIPVSPRSAGELPVEPRDPWRHLFAVALMLAVVAVGLSLLSVSRATRFSPVDEATHIDYAWSIAHLQLPVSGSPLSHFTLDAWACRGQANIKKLPPCGGNAPSAAFPGRGEQYNGFHPPVYYAITGLTARPVAALIGQDFIGVARSLGAGWLFAAMFALYVTLRYWRVEWQFALLGSLTLPLIPPVLHASSAVSNDAPAALSGVAAAFVLGRVLIYRRTGWGVPALLALLAASTKTLNAVGLLVVAGLLILLALCHWRRYGWRAVLPWLRTGLMMFVAVGVTYVTWNQISSRTGWVNPITHVNQSSFSGGPFDEWLPSLVSGFRLGSPYSMDPAVDSTFLLSWALVATLLMSAAPFVGLALFRRGTPRWLLALTLLLGCLLFPLLAQLRVLATAGTYFAVVSPRYGLSLIPIALAVLTVIATEKRLRITSIVLVGIGLVVVLTTTAGLVN
jgi:hypothetical protein